MNNSNPSSNGHGQMAMLAGMALTMVFVALVYLWFVSSGHWTNWRTTSDFYSLLADGFRHGQLSLMIKPDPRLLTLPNPYDPAARAGIPSPIDVSLYKNNYFLYFGPLPGILVAALSVLFPNGIDDQYLTFAFTLGIFLLQSLLLLKIRRTFFSNLPGWMDVLGILLVGLIGPFTRLLVHPFIYEAALAGGQFFFTAGLYFTFLAIAPKPVKTVWLWAASLTFLFAIATRIMQLFPIAFMSMMISILLIGDARGTGSKVTLTRSMTALLLPLALGGACLAWYNWIRFGSIFEFGLYYQLAYNLQSFYHTLFLPGYIPQNLYNYLFNPFTVSKSFPFVNPLPGNKAPIFGFYNLPQPYIVDGYITGLIFSSPFILFSILPLVLLVVNRLRRRVSIPEADRGERAGLFNWAVLSLAGSCLAAAAPVMLFFYAATRYEVDFFTPLAMLGLIGFWQVYLLLGHQARRRKWFVVLGTSLAILSMVLNMVIAFASHLTWFGIN
jgi:hypothetical protein